MLRKKAVPMKSATFTMAQKEFLAEIVPKTPIVAHVYKIFHEQFPDSRICSQRIKAERTRILKHHVWDQDKDDGAVKENETKQEKAVRKFQRQQEAKRRRLWVSWHPWFVHILS